jgi:hypothetical protein
LTRNGNMSSISTKAMSSVSSVTATGRRGSSPSDRRRVALIGGLGLALVAVILLIPRPGGDDASVPTPTSEAVDSGPAIVGTPIDPAIALADVKAAVDAVLAAESLVLRARSDLDGLVETFDVDIDAAGRSFRSIGTVGNTDGVDATFEKIEVPDNVYMRVIDDEGGAPPMWSVIPIEVAEQSELSSVYTAFGRITPELDDLVVMAEALTLRTETIADGPRNGYRLTARTDEVSRYLRENRLASVGASDEIGASVWEVWIEEGWMTHLVASGVQFFTGEPFRNALIEIEYEQAQVEVRAPEVDDVGS